MNELLKWTFCILLRFGQCSLDSVRVLWTCWHPLKVSPAHLVWLLMNGQTWDSQCARLYAPSSTRAPQVRRRACSDREMEHANYCSCFLLNGAIQSNCFCFMSVAEEKAEVGRFSKNFLPILFNVYSEQPAAGESGTYRMAMLDTIKVYLTVTDTQVSCVWTDHFW